MMKAWNDFTDSLNTAGGTVALLFVCTFLLGLCVVHLMHHGDGGASASILQTTFANFTGALLLALTQKSRNGNGNGSDHTPPNPNANPTQAAAAAEKTT